MRLNDLVAQFNLANQFTFLRLVAVPFFAIAVLQGRFGVALALFVAAAFTDVLDGLSARAFGTATRLGAYLDPAADKLLLTVGFLLLTAYPSMLREIPMVARIPIWLTILTISRDVLIVGIAVTLHLSQGQTRFPPSIFGKLTTVAESLTVGLFLCFNYLGRSHPILGFMVWATLAMTLASGFHYLGRTMRKLAGTDGAGPDDDGS